MTTITTIHQLPDDLTAADYRAIYDELRTRSSLRAFATAINSTVTHAWWAKFENGQATLTSARQNELRRAVGLPERPLPVVELLAPVAPTATIHLVGGGPASRVALLGADTPADVTLTFCGAACTVAPEGHVTAVTPPPRPAPGARRIKPPNRYFRPNLPLIAAARVPRLAELLTTALQAQIADHLAAGVPIPPAWRALTGDLAGLAAGPA